MEARRAMRGDRWIDFCIDHFAPMGYHARKVRAVVADLLKVYGGRDGWIFLEDGSYQVVQDRLLEIEEEEKKMQKQGQEMQPDCHQQQDGQQVEEEAPQQVVQDMLLEIEDGEKLKHDQQLQHQQQDALQVEDEREPPQVSDRVLPRAPALTTWGGDASSSTTQLPSSDNIEHDIAQPTTPHDFA